MSVFNRIVIAVLLVLVLLWGISLSYSLHIGEKLEKAQGEISQLKQARELADAAEISAMAARKVENEKAKQREQLMENVLGNNDDWSHVAIPNDITRMLQQDAAIYGSDSCFPASGDASR